MSQSLRLSTGSKRDAARSGGVRRAGLAAVSLIAAASLVPGLGPPPASAFEATQPPSQTVAGTITDRQIEDAIARLDTLASDIMDATGIPGLAVAVVWRGETVYAKGFGLRAVGGPEKVDADTVFQIASLSKSISSSVVARQVGEGVVSWDTPIVEHLPWFALSDPWVTERITLADMFTHRSGLPDHAGDILEDLGYDRRQILERLRRLPLAPFRSTYAYTNFGVTAAAEAVAAAAGTDWASLCETTIYEPLGMSSTSSRHADFAARDNRALGHVRSDGGFAVEAQRQPDAQSPAGGVSSSVNDFARWMAMMLDGGRVDGRSLIDEAALLEAMTGHIVSRPTRALDARASLYGYGFNVSTQPSARVLIGHSGAFALGAATNFELLPSAALGIAVFSNAVPIGAVESLTAQFMDLVQFGAITRDWLAGYGVLIAPMLEPEGALVAKAPPSDPAPAGELSRYAGTYTNDYYGDARVAVEDGALAIHLGPADDSYRLAHWSGDTFTFKPRKESFPEGSVSEVAFVLGADGSESARMTIELLNENGLGTFLRASN